METRCHLAYLYVRELCALCLSKRASSVQCRRVLALRIQAFSVVLIAFVTSDAHLMLDQSVAPLIMTLFNMYGVSYKSFMYENSIDALYCIVSCVFFSPSFSVCRRVSPYFGVFRRISAYFAVVQENTRNTANHDDIRRNSVFPSHNSAADFCDVVGGNVGRN